MRKKIVLNFLTALAIVLLLGSPVIAWSIFGVFSVGFIVLFFIGLALLVGWILEIKGGKVK